MSKEVIEDERSEYDQLVIDQERRYRLGTRKSKCHSGRVGVIGRSSYSAKMPGQTETAPEIAEELPPGWECFAAENGRLSPQQVQEAVAQGAEKLVYLAEKRQPENNIPWNEWNPYRTSTSIKNWFAAT